MKPQFAFFPALLGLVWLACAPAARAQIPAGSLDGSFNPGSGTDGPVYAVALQNDGRILLGGNFTNAEGFSRRYVARLNGDGSLDGSFDPGAGPGDSVNAVAVQVDGRILIGGDFTLVGTAGYNRVARLYANGTLDGSFAPNPGANFSVLTLTIQDDGNLLLGGSFSSVDGVVLQGIARLNGIGGVDSSFVTGQGVTGGGTPQVLAAPVQRDGKIVIGGNFTQVGGVPSGYLARLNPNGSLDTSFNPGTGPDSIVDSVAIQPDGKIVIGGDFITVDGVARSHVARLYADGTLDPTFDPGVGPDGAVLALAVQTNGRIVIGGRFSMIGSAFTPYVSRLNADGTFDPTFFPGYGPDRSVTSVAVQPNGQIVIGGNFIQVDRTPRNHVARLNGDGGHPAFFTGEVGVGNGVFYLAFANGNYFGYYSYLADSRYIYHFDLGYEYLFDAADGFGGVYLYDFASQSFFYTSPTYGFPYLYDFSLNTVLYYFPDTTNAGHYKNNPRYFYNPTTGQIITK